MNIPTPTNVPAIGAATGTHEYHHCELPLYFNGCKGVHDARPEVAGGVQSRTARTAEAGDRTPDRNPTPMALAPGAPANDGPCGITSAASARTRVPRNSVAKPLARLPRGVDGGERAEHVLEFLGLVVVRLVGDDDGQLADHCPQQLGGDVCRNDGP